MKFKLHKNESGFTLIELMATLAILALIVVIAVPSIGKIIANAEEDSEAASIAMIEKAGSIADAAGLEHDNASHQQYLLTSLIGEGYLDIAPDDDLVINDSYVQKVGDSGNTYEYMADAQLAEGDDLPDYAEWLVQYIVEDGGTLSTETSIIGQAMYDEFGLASDSITWEYYGYVYQQGYTTMLASNADLTDDDKENMNIDLYNGYYEIITGGPPQISSDATFDELIQYVMSDDEFMKVFMDYANGELDDPEIDLQLREYGVRTSVSGTIVIPTMVDILEADRGKPSYPERDYLYYGNGSDDGYTLENYHGYDEHLKIPSTVHGQTVRSISPVLKQRLNPEVKIITIPDSATYMVEGFFHNREGSHLREIYLPNADIEIVDNPIIRERPNYTNTHEDLTVYGYTGTTSGDFIEDLAEMYDYLTFVPLN